MIFCALSQEHGVCNYKQDHICQKMGISKKIRKSEFLIFGEIAISEPEILTAFFANEVVICVQSFENLLDHLRVIR